MMNCPTSIKLYLRYLVPIPRMAEDEHDDLIPVLDLGDLSSLTVIERRALLLVVATELTGFLGDDCPWIARLDLTRTAIRLEMAFRDPHPAFERLVDFCEHWRIRRAELAS